MFWWVSHGIEDPEGGLAMPGFAGVLTENDRWSVIDAIRTLNAGTSMQLSGSWPQAIRAPDLPITCASTAINRLSDLRGRFVRIVTTPTTVRPPEGTTILRLDRDNGQPPPKSGCTSATSDAWIAYAAIAGTTPDALAGWEFLVDTQGWLRVAHGGDGGPDWNDPTVLKNQLLTLQDQPITSALGGTHVHEH